MATENIAAQLLSDLKRDFGLTDAQAAGVVGNLMHESGGFQSLQEQNPGSGRGGFGYAQWTGARRNAFENFAAQNGLDPNSYEANYGYLKHELNTDPYERRQFDTVKQAKTAAEAAKLVSDNFLRPGTPNIAARQNYANQALGYASSPVPPGEIPNTVASQLSVVPPRLPPTPAGVEERVTARNTNPPNSLLQQALNAEAARRATVINNQVTPASVEDRVTARNRVPLPSAFNGDLMTPASGPVVASYSTASLFNGDPLTPSNGPVIASIPSRPTAPTTRPVTTIPVGNSSNNIAAQKAEQMATRPPSRPAPSVPQISVPYNPLTQAQKLAIMSNSASIPDRLPTGSAGLPALYGTMSPTQVAQIGLPSLAPPQVTPMANQVGTKLSVAPPISVPLPRPRPSFPMPANQVPQRAQSPLRILVNGATPIRPVAPIPMQRPIQRPIAPVPLNSVGGSAIWGFSGAGSSGGAHGGSDNDKHRGEEYVPNRR